ncbi:hypothetical protein D4764_13G0012460 [Takifugu flavidus]|uniref:Uncharacterized protein n=1 Tax=Takifugu flavidus TaxID=433684 RepID=A0A5C6P9X5_9TELE|nr:hypothetical protein D4764_13G0012460 [Takifugu flavidus]
MNRGVVVFIKEERLVADLLASGVTLNGAYLQVSSLTVPSTWVTVSGVSPFIPNETLKQELQHFRKMASGLKTVGPQYCTCKYRKAGKKGYDKHLFLLHPQSVGLLP